MTNKIESIINKLNEAYGSSTPSDNKFAEAINSIKWDATYEEDGEIYYLLDDLTLTVQNLNPFEETYKPTVIAGTFYKELGW